jgi:hypothetical protein
MALPLETLALGANPTCSDCKETVKLRVCKSFAGYYIGSYCDCGPYSRESDYYTTREKAEAALKKGGFER